MLLMSGPPIDLFDDPPWPTEVSFREASSGSPRPLLIGSLAFVGLFSISMALPWFTSAETPQWTPFSHWLNRGFVPGTQEWGFVMLALDIVTAFSIVMAIIWARRSWQIALLGLATILVLTTISEASAHLSPAHPGPNLGADYGAWIGVAMVVLAWWCLALATIFRHSWRSAHPEHPRR